jgi:hypothetical protein
MRRGKHRANQLVQLHEAIKAAKAAGAWEFVAKLLSDARLNVCLHCLESGSKRDRVDTLLSIGKSGWVHIHCIDSLRDSKLTFEFSADQVKLRTALFLTYLYGSE